jgi:Rrf2 family transcriptional regulator, iron-sulfur cluster assembly transcription factor
MILGTKARYAVMALVDLARYGNGRPVALADVATRQEVSLAYLEQIFPKLKKAGLVKPVRGPGGGYMLARGAEETWILSIINAVDESLSMTRCSKEHAGGCMSNKSPCLTHALWAGMGEQLENYLSRISLEDVIERRLGSAKQNMNLRAVS